MRSWLGNLLWKIDPHCGGDLEGYPYGLGSFLTRCVVRGQRAVFGARGLKRELFMSLPVRADEQGANDLIAEKIRAGVGAYVGRFGGYELEAVLRGMEASDARSWPVKLARMAVGKSGPFWWDNSVRGGMYFNAGFFPPDNASLNEYSRICLEDCRQIDVLAITFPGDAYLSRRYFPSAVGISLAHLEPFWVDRPWSAALEGKKVLAVYPFADTIRAQYGKRKELFRRPDVLPEFELKTYRTLSSFAGNKIPYPSWFAALDRMKSDISKIDFDVALIGCGAYGFNLGCFIKRDLGKVAVHLGGVTQLLFGIKGRRWDTHGRYSQDLYTDSWVRPFASDTVANATSIEGGCYW